MRPAAFVALLSAILLAGPSLAAAGTLCHTDTEAHACCCAPSQSEADCEMSCADPLDGRQAAAPPTASPRSESPAAVFHSSGLRLAADAAATRPMRSARAPDTLPEALYLLDRTLRL